MAFPGTVGEALIRPSARAASLTGSVSPAIRARIITRPFLPTVDGRRLDRHEAIHAIGWVLIEFMSDLMGEPESSAEPNAPYFAALERLTVEDWRRVAQ